MRLLSGLLFVALTGSIALADDAKDAKPAEPQPAPASAVKAPKVPLRVVRVLAETHQALLFDKNKGTHVLADVGKSIDGFTVDEIDDDAVTLTAENGAQIVLAAPDPSWRWHHSDTDDEARPARPARRAKDAPAAKDAAGPQDPYGAAPMSGPEDPYGEAPVRAVEAPGAPTVAAPIEAGEGGVRTAEAPTKPATTVEVAPIAAGEGGVRTAEAPAKPAAAPKSVGKAPAKPAAKSGEVRSVEAPDAAAADALAAAITAPPGAIVVARTDVNAALGNFAALAGSIRGSFTPAGAKLDSVATGSLFAKAGLRAGDTIVAVDNHPLHSIDDAADLYARSSAAKLVTLQIVRANKPMTLQVSIQ